MSVPSTEGNAPALESGRGNSSPYAAWTPHSLSQYIGWWKQRFSGNKPAFPSFALDRLHWQNFKSFNQIQDHNIRQMLPCWLTLTVWSLSKSCFVFCDFYASIDVQYQTICNSTGKASYKFVFKPYVKKAHLSKHTSLF